MEHLAGEQTLPVHGQREFEATLKCGRLERSFLRVRCADCHRVKVIASIEDPAVIKQILAHLERRTEPATPAFRPFARAPPQPELPGLDEPG